MIDLDIRFTEEPFCEHCIKLQPFNAVVDDGLTSWCLDCAEGMELVSEEVIKKAYQLEVELEKMYHKKKLKELDKEEI